MKEDGFSHYGRVNAYLSDRNVNTKSTGNYPCSAQVRIDYLLFPVASTGCYNKFLEATIADAILDRIVHDSYTIEIRGADEHAQKSMREVYGVGNK